MKNPPRCPECKAEMSVVPWYGWDSMYWRCNSCLKQRGHNVVTLMTPENEPEFEPMDVKKMRQKWNEWREEHRREMRERIRIEQELRDGE